VNRFETINAITENLRGLLEKEGLYVERDNFGEDKNAPAGLFPSAQLYYEGEDFEYTHGQRAGYAEATFRVRLLLRKRDVQEMIAEEQRWTHRIRDAISVNALNMGAVAASTPVSRVETRSVKVERKGQVSRLDYVLVIRYR